MNLLASDAARALGAHRRKVTKACLICGREFTGGVVRLYDRPTCSTVAYRRRRRELERAAGHAATTTKGASSAA